jgi:hypothetical protein
MATSSIGTVQRCVIVATRFVFLLSLVLFVVHSIHACVCVTDGAELLQARGGAGHRVQHQQVHHQLLGFDLLHDLSTQEFIRLNTSLPLLVSFICFPRCLFFLSLYHS